MKSIICLRKMSHLANRFRIYRFSGWNTSRLLRFFMFSRFRSDAASKLCWILINILGPDRAPQTPNAIFLILYRIPREAAPAPTEEPVADIVLPPLVPMSSYAAAAQYEPLVAEYAPFGILPKIQIGGLRGSAASFFRTTYSTINSLRFVHIFFWILHSWMMNATFQTSKHIAAYDFPNFQLSRLGLNLDFAPSSLT